MNRKRFVYLLLCLSIVFLISNLPWVSQLCLAAPNIAAETQNIFLPLVLNQSSNNQGPDGKVSNLEVITSSVARNERFEIRFDLETPAENLDLPFDPNPPPGLQAGIGVTVDALFSGDDWETTFTQPAFLYQIYQHMILDEMDHFVPNTAPKWTVRFTPQSIGTWQYRLRIEDVEGLSYYPALDQPALSFAVVGESSNPHSQKGFLNVSSNDARYFEFQDGTPFVGVGFNDGFDSSFDVGQKMVSYEQNKINFVRVWLSGASINGSQWTSWASHHLSHDDYLPGVNFDSGTTYNQGDVSLKLDDSNPCLFSDFWQGGIPALPDTQYNVWARVKVENVTGPQNAGAYGFVVKQGDWLGTECDQPNQGELITSPLSGNSDWLTVEGTYTTDSDQYWLDNLYLARQNATGGNIFIDEVRLWRSDDPHQVNILREPYANSVMHFDPLNAAKWDLFIQQAEEHGVYIKLVIDEKNEWLRNHLDENGQITSSGSNDNFYASPGTKSRWLQQAWWRYIIARWGYSTAIHSYEYINEGDPYNGGHHEATNAMAEYFHSLGSSRFLVTTSFWAAFPNYEFWSNPQYPDIDYADLHAYVSTGWGQTAAFWPEEDLETQAQYVFEGQASARVESDYDRSESIVPRGLVIQGAGEWVIRYQMKTENFAANCSYNSTGSMQRIRWTLDGGEYSGGREGVIPARQDGKDFLCSSPSGSYDWTLFSSERDRDGSLLPSDLRLIITDNLPHEIDLRIENYDGTQGTAWIDNVELISPWGQVVQTIGKFDTTLMDEDTAFYNRAYGELWCGECPAGARMPLIRGETGVDYPDNQDWNRDLLLDNDGIWLHNNVWGQINPGGMYDLFWWASETIPPSLYHNFLTFRNFMADIPLSNGAYRDAGAQTSHPDLRAWGQRDDINGRMHLWIQNIQHTWTRVVHGPDVTPVTGQVVLYNVVPGQYQVEWWDPYELSDPIVQTQTISSDGTLTLTLPQALDTDIAVKINLTP